MKKKHARKGFVSLLAAAMLVSALAGCGQQKEQTETAQGAGAAEAKVNEIEGGNGGGATVEKNLEEEALAELMASHTLEDGRTKVTVAVEADPGTLSPYGSGVGKVQHVIRNALFETAMVIGSDGNLYPYLASGYEQVDEVTYDIHFKDYVYDTQGNHLTAEDVVFSWKCGRDEWSAGNLSFMKDAEAIDTYTVRLTMVSPQLGTFEKIMYEGWIFTKAAYENSPDQFITTPVGTSQYQLVSWETGSEIVIEKTGNYWEKDESNLALIQQANVDVVDYKIIAEEAQRIIAMQTGEVDMIHKVDFSSLENFEEGYEIFSTLNNQVMTMMFNCSDKSPCGDQKVRQAICYAIDAAGVLDVVASGQGKVTWALATEGSADALDAWNEQEYYGYDVEKAMELLEEVGYDSSNPLKIRLMYETTDKNAPTAEILQAYLMAAGVEVDMFPCEGATYSTYKYTSTEFDIHIGSVGGIEPFCITAWYPQVYGTGVDDTTNTVALDDPKIVEMIDVCYDANTTSGEKMTELLDYINENAYMYPLYRYMLYTVTNDVFTTMNLRCGGREIAPQYCEYIWNE